MLSPSLTLDRGARTTGQNALLHTNDDSLYTSVNAGLDWHEVEAVRGRVTKLAFPPNSTYVRRPHPAPSRIPT